MAANTENDLRREIQRLRQDMQNMQDSMMARLEDVIFNTRAQVLNSTAVRQESILRPIKNLETREVVELPRTLGELNEMPGTQIDCLLYELRRKPGEATLKAGDEPDGRSVLERRDELKMLIGIKT